MDNKAKKELFEKEFKEIAELIKNDDSLDPRAKATAITNLQTAKMWAVLAIFKDGIL